jgi:hypothetical protein
MSDLSCGNGLSPHSGALGAASGLFAGRARSHRGAWLALGLMIVAGNALAAPKACEALKAEIEAKIQAQGVTSYTLEIITAEEAKSQDPSMIVGSCNFGRMKIIYQKNDR